MGDVAQYWYPVGEKPTAALVREEGEASFLRPVFARHDGELGKSPARPRVETGPVPQRAQPTRTL